MRNKTVLTAVLAGSLAALLGAGSAGSGLQPGVITGLALDARGKPIAGALVWVRPALTTGLVTAHTDETGRYTAKVHPNLPYKVSAWAQPTYRGKRYCLRLGHDKINDYDTVAPTNGAVRDFRWKLTGEIGDFSGRFFGGEVRIFRVFDGDNYVPTDAKLEFRLEPLGTLVDGSQGKTLVIPVDSSKTSFLEDIPVGDYKVTVVQLEPGGGRLPVKVGLTDREVGSEATLEFTSAAGCGGNGANGTERVFLYIAKAQ